LEIQDCLERDFPIGQHFHVWPFPFKAAIDQITDDNVTFQDLAGSHFRMGWPTTTGDCYHRLSSALAAGYEPSARGV